MLSGLEGSRPKEVARATALPARHIMRHIVALLIGIVVLTPGISGCTLELDDEITSNIERGIAELETEFTICNDVATTNHGSYSMADRLKDRFDLYMHEHPEIFYIDTYPEVIENRGDPTDDNDDTTSIIVEYVWPVDETREMIARYEQKMAEAISLISDDMSTKDKVQVLYEWLANREPIQEQTNDEDAADPRATNYGPIVLGEGTNTAYARAMRDLLWRANILTNLKQEDDGSWSLDYMDGIIWNALDFPASEFNRTDA